MPLEIVRPHALDIAPRARHELPGVGPVAAAHHLRVELMHVPGEVLAFGAALVLGAVLALVGTLVVVHMFPELAWQAKDLVLALAIGNSASVFLGAARRGRGRW